MKKKGTEGFDPNTYGIRTFSFNLIYPIWHEYPRTVKNVPFLTVAYVTKNKDFHSDYKNDLKWLKKQTPFASDYEAKTLQYYNPNLDEFVIDVGIALVPKKVVKEEYDDLPLFESESREFYYLEAMKRRLSKDRLYEFYAQDYQEWDCMDYHCGENICNYLQSVLGGIQGNIVTSKAKLFHLTVLGYVLNYEKNGQNEWVYELLNGFKTLMPERPRTAYDEFLQNSYQSVEGKLSSDAMISVCHKCGSMFKYMRDKKYCSKVCRKKQERERYYLKNAEKIRDKMRKHMKETRASGGYIDKRRLSSNKKRT